MANDIPIRISELEKLSGVNRSTIHFYLRKGLLSPPIRTGRTMAYYSSRHLEELAAIKRMREEGLPLSFIGQKLHGRGPGGAYTEGEEEPALPERRQQIIDAAVRIFARKGYHQTRVSDITDAVGVGHSTFYIYFPSKKALFMECVDDVFQAMFIDVWDEIKNEKDPIKRLRKRAEVALKSHPQFIDILVLLRTTGEEDPWLNEKRREIYSSIVDTVKRDLVKAINQGLLQPIDVELASFIVVGFLETAALRLSLDNKYTIDGLLDTLEEMLLYRSGEK